MPVRMAIDRLKKERTDQMGTGSGVRTGQERTGEDRTGPDWIGWDFGQAYGVALRR